MLTGIRQAHKVNALIEDMLGPKPSSCRQLAAALTLDKSTVWQWRRKVSLAFVVTDRASLTEPIETAAAVVRESRKASREWVNHRRDPARHAQPDRWRWLDYRRLGLVPPDHLPRYRISVELTLDRMGERSATVRFGQSAHDRPEGLPDPSSPMPATTADGKLANDTVQPPPGACQTREPLRPKRLLPRRQGMLNEELAHFRQFLGPFCGPATRHLPAYVAWFVTRRAREPATGRTQRLRRA